MAGVVPLAAALLVGLVPMAAAAGIPERAQPSQAMPSLFTDADYPAEAVRNHIQGAVGFRLEVGSDGRPTAARS